MDIHLAAGTALCSFFFTAIFGTYLHWKCGNLRRELVVPMTLGGIVFGGMGALANNMIGSGSLTAIIAWIIVFAGVAVLRPMPSMISAGSHRDRKFLLFSIGAFVGFMAGLTGVGGPVLSVPIMIALFFDPRISVAAALPLQLAGCFSGTLGNVLLGQVDWSLMILTVAIQIVGFWLGQRWGRKMDTQWLKKCVAILCIGTGVIMLVR
jgi:uncharacterized membrane protein YfcA